MVMVAAPKPRVAGRAAGIRDSKSPERGHLAVELDAFAAFLADIKASRRDLA
jgi:hypothetical protein